MEFKMVLGFSLNVIKLIVSGFIWVLGLVLVISSKSMGGLFEKLFVFFLKKVNNVNNVVVMSILMFELMSCFFLEFKSSLLFLVVFKYLFRLSVSGVSKFVLILLVDSSLKISMLSDMFDKVISKEVVKSFFIKLMLLILFFFILSSFIFIF